MKSLSEYIPLIGMAGFIILVQVLALMMAQPMEAGGMCATDNPESVWNSVYYIAIILLFTLFILIVIKMNKKYVLHGILLFAVAATMYYVFITFMGVVASATLTALLTALLYKFPEWYVVDITGILVGAGASAILGISLAILPTIILLILLLVYDFISVYKTKHMIALAEGVMELHAPILFVVPKRKGYSFMKQDFTSDEDGERGAYFMGLGDAVMPTILVVSANTFLLKAYPDMTLLFGYAVLPAVLAAIGTLIGYVVLMAAVAGGKPQAGLPFLNTGAIAGYVVGCLVAGVSVLPPTPVV